MRTRVIAVLAGVIATLGLAVVSTPAAAATVTPAINCIQNPGTNGGNTGHFTGQGVNIRTGPSTTCTVVGSGFESNAVTARCGKPVGSQFWVYLKDRTTGKIGWSEYPLITWDGGLPQC